MSQKILKSENQLLQAKLDDALAEIAELTNLVEMLEKEKHNGIEFINESTGVFRIDQINVGYLHRQACEYLLKNYNLDYDKKKPHLDDPELFKIATHFAAELEAMEYDTDCIIDESVGELAETYKKRMGVKDPKPVQEEAKEDVINIKLKITEE